MVGNGHVAIAAVGACGKVERWRVRAEVSCHGLALLPTHRIGDRHHCAPIERAENARRRHLIERSLWRDTFADLVMTTRASLLVYHFARCLGRSILCGHPHGRENNCDGDPGDSVQATPRAHARSLSQASPRTSWALASNDHASRIYRHFILEERNRRTSCI